MHSALSRCPSVRRSDTVPSDLHAPTAQPKTTLTGQSTAGERRLLVLDCAHNWLQIGVSRHKP